MNHKNLTLARTSLTLVTVAALSACAVTPFEVAKEAKVRETEAKVAVDLSRAPEKAAPVSGLKRMTGNFLGAAPIPISHSVSLPPHVRNITMSFGNRRGSLEEVARNIRTATGLTVRINPDVTEAGGPIEVVQQPVVMASSTPMPSPMPNGAQPLEVNQPVVAMGMGGGRLPLSHQGDLAEYLNSIASTLDVNWEYSKGEIVFFKAMTRRFQLAVSPGVLAYRDDVSSGGSGSGGASATAGSFASTSNASVEAQLSPWQGVEDAVRSMITPGTGKMHVNQASGAIVVTDTKSKLDQIGKYIEEENALLNRQVRIEMREVLVERTGEASVGLDVNIVYNRFLEAGLDVNAGLGAAGDLINAANPSPNYSINTTAPASLASANSGTMTLNFQRQGYFQGTTMAMKALNGVGKVVGDSTRTIVTTNRTPGRLQDVIDRAYLAETKPASGGALEGGGGVPGLVPGLVTYGENITVIPTIRDNNEILLQLFSTRSSLLELNSQTAGSGATFQQINTPVLQRKKNSQNIRMRDQETLVIVSNASDLWNSKDRVAITGGSTSSTRANVISVLMVTARVMGI